MSVTTFTLPQSIILKKLLEDDLWLKIEDPRGDQCDESSLKKERNYSWQTINKLLNYTCFEIKAKKHKYVGFGQHAF